MFPRKRKIEYNGYTIIQKTSLSNGSMFLKTTIDKIGYVKLIKLPEEVDREIERELTKAQLSVDSLIEMDDKLFNLGFS